MWAVWVTRTYCCEREEYPVACFTTRKQLAERDRCAINDDLLDDYEFRVDLERTMQWSRSALDRLI